MDCNSKHLNNGHGRFQHCLDRKKQDESLTDAQRDDMLLKLSADSLNMKTMLASVLALLQKAPDTITSDFSKSPVRKSARVDFPVDGSSPALHFFDSTAKSPHTAYTTYSDKVKMNIRKNAVDANSNLLKSLYEAKSLVPDFTGRKKMDGSVDVLFKNFEDANKAKAILDNKLINAVINCPARAKQSRFNLVGLPFEMSVSEVVDALVEENKHWLDLRKSADNLIDINGDPFSCIYVHSISKCKSGDVFIKAIVSVSANMLATMGQRRLSVGFVKCKLYEWKTHRRCFRCQEVGHFAASCTRTIDCSKCSGEYLLKDCESNFDRCVNCVLNQREDISHPSSSYGCPYNNKPI